MARRTKADSTSLALFSTTEEPDHEPGHTDLQRLASESSRKAMVFNQPMQTIALKPTHGAITRMMSLVWLKIIQEIQKQPEALVYEIRVKDLVDYIGDTKNYDRLKDVFRALNGVQVEWNAISEEGEQWTVSSLLSQAKVIRKGGSTRVQVSLPPDLNTGVRELRQFSALNLLVAKELKSAAALNLFRIAVAYETNPSKVTFRKPVHEWEALLRGVPRPPDTEFVYKYFKRDTVLPAMAEVARLTHLMLELIEHREGRVVRELQFRVLQKEALELQPTPENMADTEAMAMLKSVGVRTAEAKSMVSSYGAERVRRNMAYMKEQQAAGDGKVRNATAYIKAAVQNDYADREVVEGQVIVIGAHPVTKKSLNQQQSERELAMQGFQAHRRAEANSLFMEMPTRESNGHWEDFVKETKAAANQTLVSSIKSKGLKAKLVQIAFFDWLADRLLGQINDQSFVDYLVGQTAAKAAPPRKRARETKAALSS